MEEWAEDRVKAAFVFAKRLGIERPAGVSAATPEQLIAWYGELSGRRDRAAQEVLLGLTINAEAEVARFRDAIRLGRSGQDVPLYASPPAFLTKDELVTWGEKQREFLNLAQLQERISFMKRVS